MSTSFLQRYMAWCVAFCLAMPAGQAFALPPAGQQSPDPAPISANAGQEPGAQSSSDASQSGANQQPANPNRPVGTAAAPYESSSGVTGSRPAGAVIAPAKQRRVRAIFIKIAVVVGAGAAVAAVVALSRASPSQPH